MREYPNTIINPLLFSPKDPRRPDEILPLSCLHGLPEGQEAGAALTLRMLPAAPHVSQQLEFSQQMGISEFRPN